MGTPMRFCQHCGAQISVNAQFCKICGKPVASIAPPISATPPPFGSAQPPVAASRPSNRGLIIGLAILGALVVLGCLAVGVFGFLFLQSKPAVLSQLPAGTPQVVVVPTYVVPTNVPPSVATTVRPPTSAPLATSTPSLPAGVLFYDDFASQEVSKRNGWTLGTDEVADRTWSPNQYTISVKKPNYFMSATPNGEYDNFGIEAEAQMLGSGYAEYGLVFRSTKTGGAFSYYLFAVTSDGRFYLDKKVADKWSDAKPVNYTDSQFITKGKGKNTLGVIVQANQISLFINRVLVTKVTDNSITGKGDAGVMVQMGDKDIATVGFSRFTIYTPDKAQAEWCPPPTAALPAGVLFNEDFSSARVAACNDWWNFKLDYADALWSPNAYTLSIKKPNTGAMNTMEIPGRQYADFALETEAQPLDENVNVYGLVFRFTQDQNGKLNYYRFALVPDGRYSLGKLVAGEWQTRVVDYTVSPLIKTGKNKNILGVIAQGNTFSLYINRTLVKTVTDDTIKGSGTVGITVGNATQVPAAATFSRVTILTPDKARVDWGGAPASSAPPVVSSLPQPEIVSVEFPSEIAANGTKYDGLVRFRDGGGDIARVSFDPAFIQPQGFNYGPFGFEFTNPAVRWVEGNATSTSGAFRFSNSCTGDTLLVTYTATLYDKAGNKSAPYPFSFLCKGNSLVVFFTIQNGSPTGYVIDKQGAKHTPPGYLTISGFHVAPGDRIVIQTDQPRFSLLFDCGTTPKNFAPCDFVADTPASLPGWVTKNTNGTAYLNISRADNWAGARPGFPSQRYPADPVLRIGLGD